MFIEYPNIVLWRRGDRLNINEVDNSKEEKDESRNELNIEILVDLSNNGLSNFSRATCTLLLIM